MRLSAISFAGTARTLVAVGTVSDASMFATMRAATPRIGLVWTPVGPAFAAFAAGAAGSAFAGAGAAWGAAGAVAVAGASRLPSCSRSAWPRRPSPSSSCSMPPAAVTVAVVEAAAAAGCVVVAGAVAPPPAAPSADPAAARRPFVAVPFVVGAGPPANASAGL